MRIWLKIIIVDASVRRHDKRWPTHPTERSSISPVTSTTFVSFLVSVSMPSTPNGNLKILPLNIIITAPPCLSAFLLSQYHTRILQSLIKYFTKERVFVVKSQVQVYFERFTAKQAHIYMYISIHAWDEMGWD
ncbi:hypothetical protein V6Z11_A08G135300 [Gossypium hirsutum]